VQFPTIRRRCGLIHTLELIMLSGPQVQMPVWVGLNLPASSEQPIPVYVLTVAAVPQQKEQISSGEISEPCCSVAL
jgi:hypothetical protein